MGAVRYDPTFRLWHLLHEFQDLGATITDAPNGVRIDFGGGKQATIRNKSLTSPLTDSEIDGILRALDLTRDKIGL